MSAYRGQYHAANAVGTACDDKAIYSYMPEVVKSISRGADP